jgi:hypothetical protein
VAIGAHFLGLLMLVLAAQSGPWAMRFGESPAEGPLFAAKINNVVTPAYFQPLRMTHNYHFASDRVTPSQVYFEARLKDAAGNVTTLKFPDPDANPWVRHRETLLALGLGDDMPVQTARSEVIPAPGQKMRTRTIWEPVKGSEALVLRELPEHLIPKDRPVFSPSDWTLLLARGYARHLCRVYDAVSVELIRHSKDPVMPAALFMNDPPADWFNELVCSFGEVRRED